MLVTHAPTERVLAAAETNYLAVILTGADLLEVATEEASVPVPWHRQDPRHQPPLLARESRVEKTLVPPGSLEPLEDSSNVPLDHSSSPLQAQASYEACPEAWTGPCMVAELSLAVFVHRADPVSSFATPRKHWLAVMPTALARKPKDQRWGQCTPLPSLLHLVTVQLIHLPRQRRDLPACLIALPLSAVVANQVVEVALAGSWELGDLWPVAQTKLMRLPRHRLDFSHSSFGMP